MLDKYKEVFSLSDKDWHISQHRSQNRSYGWIPIFYWTVPCEGRR